MPNLNDLISEGMMVYQKCCHHIEDGDGVVMIGFPDNYIDGEDYEKWIAKCVIYMEKNHTDSALYGQFLETSKNAVGKDKTYYEKMMGILKAIQEME